MSIEDFINVEDGKLNCHLPLNLIEKFNNLSDLHKIKFHVSIIKLLDSEKFKDHSFINEPNE